MKKLLVMITLVFLLAGCVMDMNAPKKEANQDGLLDAGNDSIGSIEPATDLPISLPSDDVSTDPDQPISSKPQEKPPINSDNGSGKGSVTANPIKAPDAPRQGIVASYEPMSFQAEIYRTNGFHEGVEYPQVILIDTKQQFDDYISQNTKLYDFNRMDITKYDQTFFASQSLALVVLQESSGSITHVLEDVYVNDGVMTFQIKRSIPEVGTTDMAQYHFIVSLKKDEMITSRSVVVFS